MAKDAKRAAVLKPAALLFFWLFFHVTVFAGIADVADKATATGSAVSSEAASRARLEHYAKLAIAEKLHEKKAWLNLVRYRPVLTGGFKAEADGEQFYAAQDGKHNPENELTETIRQGRFCDFPARWRWIRKELKISKGDLPPMACPGFEKFRDMTRAKSVTMVFASYYANNPSSLYGHLLLRLNRDENASGSAGELLDFGVNYAANPTTDNALLYALAGLAGFFPGTFTAMPYYYKVREYGDIDSRDLWEYRLNLTEEEVAHLVEHLWELGGTQFDYYYFSENCAYHLLGALEAVAPRLTLVEDVAFYVIPADALKAVTNEPGLVSEVRYRPSIQSQLRTRYQDLSAAERRQFHELRELPVSQWPVDSNRCPECLARVLDTILDDIDYRHARDLVMNASAPAAARKSEVLLARSRLPSAPDLIIQTTASDRPDHSHGSSRWTVEGGSRARPGGGLSQKVLDSELRFALHDLLDRSEGYPLWSTVEMFKFRFRWQPEDQRLTLRTMDFSTVASFAPWTSLERNFSWHIRAGSGRVTDLRCADCFAAQLHTLAGASITPRDGLLLYALAGPGADFSSQFAEAWWSAALMGRLGARVSLMDTLHLGIEGDWSQFLGSSAFTKFKGQAQLRWAFSPSTAAQIVVERESSHDEFRLGLLRYF